MSLRLGSIPSLHNGVSQQSSLIRTPDQCGAQENGWSSLADGTGKRAPTESVARLLDDPPADAMIHNINRDSTEQYVVIAAGGVIRVFDYQGVEKTVVATNGWGYVDTETPSTDLVMTTVADYTFVVNRKKIVAMGAVAADLSTPPAEPVTVNPNRNTQVPTVVNWTGSTLRAGLFGTYDKNPTVSPSSGTVQTFEKLPEGAPEGALYEIQGTASTKFISYYVTKSGGVWDETVKRGLANTIDYSTMPHALVRQADGTFVFAPHTWAPRRVGDEITNPPPVFVGSTIQGVFVYQNRLAFLVDESVVMSAAGEFGRFFRNTVLDYLDADPLTVSATGTKVSLLYDAVPFADGIMLTSDQTQFSLTNGESGASATSVAIRPVTNYEVNVNAGMVAVGSEVYFASNRNGYSVIREYTREADVNSTSAADITGHVPSYVPASIHKLIPAGDLNTLFSLTALDPSAVYVYQFYWVSASEKAQSAHHRWDLGEGAQVISGTYLRGFLYLLVARPDGLYLERVDLQSGATAPSCSHQVHLDRRTAITGSFNSGTQRTTFTLPYDVTSRPNFQLVRSDSFTAPLSLIDPETYVWVNDHSVTVPGNETAGPVVCGDAYTFRYQFSPVHIRRQDGSAITSGRTQLRTFTVNYRGTGYFKTSVSPYGVDAVVEEVVPTKMAEFSGKVVGAHDLVINSPAFHTGSYSFQIYGEASVAVIELQNDTHVSSTFVSAEWEALYWNRAS